ncbi:MAG: ankyrin repeat domain-containing protein [Treponema sp.]|jgi:ankyrin repeat protein|nr:ankyrin repeat domain-containing protein [Treponema sp.]
MIRKKYPCLLGALLLASLLHADDYKWDLVNALAKNDAEKAGQILERNSDSMPANEKRLIYGFVLTYTRNGDTLNFLGLLRQYNIRAVQYDLYDAISKSHTDDVITFILNDGINPNGEILLAAAEKRRWNLVRDFAGRGADVNYRYPAGRPYSDGMSALMYAAKWNDFDAVRLLVERGANVNFRARNGYTASSFASENAAADVYNYLMEHGANDMPVPDMPGNSLSEGGISSFIEKKADAAPAAFSNGTYRLSGTTAELRFSGSGGVSYRNSRGETGGGTFRINGETLVIYMEGRSFTYRVNSNRSFSGGGEVWTRTGN